MARLPVPGSDDGNWGDILNDYLAQVHKSDGTLKDNIVTSAALANGAVGTSVIQDGTVSESKLDSAAQTKLNQTAPVQSVAGKTGTVTLDKSDIGLNDVDNTADVDKPVSAATQTELDKKLDEINGQSTVTDPTNQRFARVDIMSDGSPTSGWRDQLAFYYTPSGGSAQRTGYHNEYGELRARPARTNTVPLRVMAYNSDGSGQTSNLFEVAADAAGPQYLGVSTSQITAGVPIQANRSDADTSPRIRTDFTGSFNSADQNIMVNYVNGVLAGYLNEWGALRGIAPYGDALVRGIRDDTDGMSTGASAPFVHLTDRRAGATIEKLYARHWNGDLYRNDIKMADTYVRNSSGDPIPANLPAGTIVVTLGP